jgi:hypothetical protein
MVGTGIAIRSRWREIEGAWEVLREEANNDLRFITSAQWPLDEFRLISADRQVCMRVASGFLSR